MPLFAYRCLDCDAHTEVLVRNDETVVCPECGSERIERQLSRFAAVSSSASSEGSCTDCSVSQSCGCPLQGGCN